jgi:hypothetical protein
MGGRKPVGVALLLVGFLAVFNTRFGGEFLVLGIVGIVVGSSILLKGINLKERLRRILSTIPNEYSRGLRRKEDIAGIDPLLPVRVLKLAESRGGKLSVSTVAMSLDVALDDAQAALDELQRKGAASAEVDLATGVATYTFPEFLREPKETSI